MATLPMNAKVYCTDGQYGRSTNVIVDPKTEKVTHLVVGDERTVRTEHLMPVDHVCAERLVPIDYVEETTSELIRLRCSKAELDDMPPFIHTEYVATDVPDHEALPAVYLLDGLADVPKTRQYVLVSQEQVPSGKSAVHRGAPVQATDGPVGNVDELLGDPETKHITHLLMRKGHLWGEKEVFIPVSRITRVEGGTVYLDLDKKGVETLPTIPKRSLA